MANLLIFPFRYAAIICLLQCGTLSAANSQSIPKQPNLPLLENSKEAVQLEHIPSLPMLDDYLYFATREIELVISDKAFPKLKAKWTIKKLRVCWETMDHEFHDDRLQVRNAIEATWQKVTALEFVEWEKCDEKIWHVRISLKDAAPHTLGLGNEISNKSKRFFLNFDYELWSPSCKSMKAECNRKLAVHEFGHVLGLAHEQNHPDTPDYCKEEDREQGDDGDILDMTPWDPDSIMNYCNSVFLNDGKLSKYDIQVVQKMYGMPGG